MTQNARVARWVPVADPAEVGDGVVTTNPPTTGKSLTTKFLLGGGSGGGGGIAEAPSDGTPYARQDGGWVSMAIIDAGGF
jgi:hypothetical protein